MNDFNETPNFSPTEAVIVANDETRQAPLESSPLEKAIEDLPVYDSTVNQRIPVTVSDGDDEFTDTHEICSLTSPEGEAALIAFDEARQAIIRPSEGKNRFKSRSSKAAIELYDTVAVAVRENDDETLLPKDWKSQIAEEDKISVVNHILAASVVENKAAVVSVEVINPASGSRLFGRSKTGRVLTLECYSNDEILQTAHHLRRKTADDYEKYEEITGFSFDENKGLAKSDTDIFADSNWAEKGELYQSLIEKSEGYNGDAPLHHQAAIVDAYFRPNSKTQKVEQVAEEIKRRIIAQFGDSDDTVFRCPGAGSCERWDSADGANFAEKVDEACSSCERCDGRPPIAGITALSETEVSTIANRVESLLWRTRSGEKLDKLRVEPELIQLLLWRQLEAKYERRQRARLCAAMENMIAAFGGGKQN